MNDIHELSEAELDLIVGGNKSDGAWGALKEINGDNSGIYSWAVGVYDTLAGFAAPFL